MPKIVVGSHLKPIFGAAEIISPHQTDSAGVKFTTLLKVRYVLVAPCEYAVTLFGETETWANAEAVKNRFKIVTKIVFFILL